MVKGFSSDSRSSQKCLISVRSVVHIHPGPLCEVTEPLGVLSSGGFPAGLVPLRTVGDVVAITGVSGPILASFTTGNETVVAETALASATPSAPILTLPEPDLACLHLSEQDELWGP